MIYGHKFAKFSFQRKLEVHLVCVHITFILLRATLSYEAASNYIVNSSGKYISYS